MHNYALTDGLHFCEANDRFIFLDLHRDRYFALPCDAESAFRKWASGATLDQSDVTQLAPLVRRGYLIKASPGAFAPATCRAESPRGDAMQTSLADIPPRKLLEPIYDNASTAFKLAHSPLSRLVERIKDRKSKAGPPPDRIDDQLVAAFLRTKAFIDSQQRCLRWSMAMIEFLARHNRYPDLVLGVRATPFSAHAWVQDRDIVLSDTLDNVIAYTPILLV